MSDIQDSAEKIAADMRQLADDIGAGRAIVGQTVWRNYAARVEAVGTGNVAKLRGALERIIVYATSLCKFRNSDVNYDANKILDEAKAALAAPARQCDRYTGEDLDRDVDDALSKAEKDCMVDYDREDLPVRWLLSTDEQVEEYKMKFKEEIAALRKSLRG